MAQFYWARHLEGGETLKALTVPTSDGESQEDHRNSSERPEKAKAVTASEGRVGSAG